MFRLSQSTSIVDRRIVAIVTGRNMERNVGSCLDSIAAQTFAHWKVMLFDDASNDGTQQALLPYRAQLGDRLCVTTNEMRAFKLSNFAQGVGACEADDIVVEIDADDCLSRDDAFTVLHDAHITADTIWTQAELPHLDMPGFDVWRSTALPPGWTRHFPQRGSTWTRFFQPGSMRTFKAGTFQTIPSEYLAIAGDYGKVASDLVYYTSVIERTPEHRRRFIDVPTYRYKLAAQHSDRGAWHGVSADREVAREDFDRISAHVAGLAPLSALESVTFTALDPSLEEARQLKARLGTVHPTAKLACAYTNSRMVPDPAALAAMRGLIVVDVERLLKGLSLPRHLLTRTHHALLLPLVALEVMRAGMAERLWVGSARELSAQLDRPLRREISVGLEVEPVAPCSLRFEVPVAHCSVLEDVVIRFYQTLAHARLPEQVSAGQVASTLWTALPRPLARRPA